MNTSYKSTNHLLDNFAEFYSSLGRLYNSLEHNSDNPRSKLLLKYLAEQGDLMEISIRRYQQEISGKVLDSMFQYAVELEKLDHQTLPDLEPQSSSREIVAETMKVHDAMCELYQDLADRTINTPVEKMFLQLKVNAIEEKKKLVRDFQQFQDV